MLPLLLDVGLASGLRAHNVWRYAFDIQSWRTSIGNVHIRSFAINYTLQIRPPLSLIKLPSVHHWMLHANCQLIWHSQRSKNEFQIQIKWAVVLKPRRKVDFAANGICKWIVLMKNWMPSALCTWMDRHFSPALCVTVQCAVSQATLEIFATISNWKPQLEGCTSGRRKKRNAFPSCWHCAFTSSSSDDDDDHHNGEALVWVRARVSIALIYLWYFHCVPRVWVSVLCGQGDWIKYVPQFQPENIFIFYSCWREFSQSPTPLETTNTISHKRHSVSIMHLRMEQSPLSARCNARRTQQISRTLFSQSFELFCCSFFSSFFFTIRTLYFLQVYIATLRLRSSAVNGK